MLESSELHGQRLGDWLADKPFSLAMSSGFFAFFAHTGMLSALKSQGLHPVGFLGSSAGAMVGGLSAAGLTVEELRETLISLRREEFWDPWPGLGLLRGRLFRKKLESLLPVKSMQECELSVRLSVFSIAEGKTLVLEKGDLASAIHASCALPVLFQPVVRDAKLLSDGGILDRPGLQGALVGERVFYHHISSRSAWRKKNSAALKIPKRPAMASLSIGDLPRVNPFRLEQGILAMKVAKEKTLQALDRALVDSAVQV